MSTRRLMRSQSWSAVAGRGDQHQARDALGRGQRRAHGNPGAETDAAEVDRPVAERAARQLEDRGDAFAHAEAMTRADSTAVRRQLGHQDPAVAAQQSRAAPAS